MVEHRAGRGGGESGTEERRGAGREEGRNPGPKPTVTPQNGREPKTKKTNPGMSLAASCCDTGDLWRPRARLSLSVCAERSMVGQAQTMGVLDPDRRVLGPLCHNRHPTVVHRRPRLVVGRVWYVGCQTPVRWRTYGNHLGRRWVGSTCDTSACIGLSS